MADSSIQANSGSYTIVGSGSLLAFTLACASGSYAVTGTAASFVYGHPITAAVGSYSITGQSVSIDRLTAEPAGYILQGQAATLTHGIVGLLVAGSGSYAVTGSTVAFHHDVPSLNGVYSLSGTAATLIRSSGAFTMGAAVGSYILSGTASILQLDIPITPGDYRISGSTVTFRLGDSLAANTAAYIITGRAA